MKKFRLLTLLFPLLVVGVADADFWSPNNTIGTVISGPNNTIYAAGYFETLSPATGSLGVYTLADGSKDNAWPAIDGDVAALVADGNGGFYVGGEFSSVGGKAIRNLAHIYGDKTVDLNFKPEPDIQVATIDRNGTTLYIGGFFYNVGGVARRNLAAIDLTTGNVTDWAPDTDGSVSVVRYIGTRVFVGGSFTTLGGVARTNIGAVEASNGATTSFNPAADGTVYAIYYHSGTGNFIIGGDFNSFAGSPRQNLAIYSNGGVLSGYTPDPDNNVYSVVADGDNIYVGGAFDNFDSQVRSGLASFNVATNTLNPLALEISGSPKSLALSGNDLLIGGFIRSIGGTDINNFCVVDKTTGAVVNSLMSYNNYVEELLVQNGQVIAGGYFTSSGEDSYESSSVAQLDLTTGLPTGFESDIIGLVYDLKLYDQKLYVGGYLWSAPSAVLDNFAVLDSTTGELITSGISTDNTIRTVEVTESVIFIGGDFTAVQGQPRTYLAALDRNTFELLPEDISANGSVETLKVAQGKLYVGGNFTQIAGKSRERLAAIKISNRRVLPWNPGADWAVNAIETLGDKVFVGGAFSQIAGQSRSYLAALSARSGALLDLLPESSDVVYGLGVQGHFLYITGYFDEYAGALREKFAVFNLRNKTVDDLSLVFDEAARSFAFQPGAVIAGGYFTSVSYTPQYGITLADTFNVRRVVPAEVLVDGRRVTVNITPRRRASHIVRFIPRNKNNAIREIWSKDSTVTTRQRRGRYRIEVITVKDNRTYFKSRKSRIVIG